MPRVSRHGVVMTLTKGRIKFCISVPHGTVYYTATARSAVFIAVIAVSSQVGNKQWNPARIRVWTKPCRAPPHSAGPTPLQVHGGKCGHVHCPWKTRHHGATSVKLASERLGDIAGERGMARRRQSSGPSPPPCPTGAPGKGTSMEGATEANISSLLIAY